MGAYINFWIDRNYRSFFLAQNSEETMSRSSVIVVLVFLAIGLSACNNVEAPAKTPVDVSIEKEKIKANLVEMWDAIEKGDIDRYATFVHPDFTSFGETAKVLRSGKDAEVKAIKEWVEEPTVVHTEMKDAEVTVRGDTAWMTYYWSDGGTSKGEKYATKGKSTRIWVKENGNWLCIHGHYTLLEK